MVMNDLDDPTPALTADRLRSLHVPGDPLVLVNAWDVASAREVVAAGAAAVGTSSAAIAATLGEPDDDTMDLPHVLGAVRRIASAVPVPVTADLEGGYGLDGIELVCALVAAGAVGCNLEDSDHRRPGALVDAETMAARLRAVRAAAGDCGVDVVVNARIDAVIRFDGDRRAALAEVARRAHLYVEAGADCVYPIGVGDPPTAAALVAELGVPVNVNLGPGVTVAEMADAGASRVSVGPTYHRRAMADLRRRAAALLGAAGRPTASTNGGSAGAGAGE
jgi:2-methylisocitrate lyase-like PEP mutase family enzyme